MEMLLLSHPKQLVPTFDSDTSIRVDSADEEGGAGFGAVREMLTRHEQLARKARVRATLARMSASDAHAVARRILDLDAR